MAKKLLNGWHSLLAKVGLVSLSFVLLGVELSATARPKYTATGSKPIGVGGLMTKHGMTGVPDAPMPTTGTDAVGRPIGAAVATPGGTRRTNTVDIFSGVPQGGGYDATPAPIVRNDFLTGGPAAGQEAFRPANDSSLAPIRSNEHLPLQMGEQGNRFDADGIMQYDAYTVNEGIQTVVPAQSRTLGERVTKLGEKFTKITERVSFEAVSSHAADAANNLLSINKQLAAAQAELASAKTSRNTALIDKMAKIVDKLASRALEAKEAAVKAHNDLAQIHSTIVSDLHRGNDAKRELTNRAAEAMGKLKLGVNAANKALAPRASAEMPSRVLVKEAPKPLTREQKKKIDRVATAVRKTVIVGAKKAWKGLKNSAVGKYFKTPERMAHDISMLAAQYAFNPQGQTIKDIQNGLGNSVLRDYSPKDRAKILQKVDAKLAKWQAKGDRTSFSSGRDSITLSFIDGMNQSQMNANLINAVSPGADAVGGWDAMGTFVSGGAEVLGNVASGVGEVLLAFLGGIGEVLGGIVSVFD